MPDVYVGLGSNEDPITQLRAAAAALERRFGTLRRSAVYQSPAVGVQAPDYLNQVVAFGRAAGATEIKQALLTIEAEHGRRRAEPRAALCALDLDLLLYGARVDAAIGLPHRDVLRRAFVLAPLAELAPQLRHPLTGEPLGRAWRELAAAGSGVTRRDDLGA